MMVKFSEVRCRIDVVNKERASTSATGPTSTSSTPTPTSGRRRPGLRRELSRTRRRRRPLHLALRQHGHHLLLRPDHPARTTIVQPLPARPAARASIQPSPGNVAAAARWGSVSVDSGAVAVINGAEFRYGGGVGQHRRPAPLGIAARPRRRSTAVPRRGHTSRSPTTTSFDNLDAPMHIQPNGLLAGDPLRPLLSGHPFFRGNVMQRNDIDTASSASRASRSRTWIKRPAGNLNVDSVWDGTDLTYVVRGSSSWHGATTRTSTRRPAGPRPTSAPSRRPYITLTLQSTAARHHAWPTADDRPAPGESGRSVKMLNRPGDRTCSAIGIAEPTAGHLQLLRTAGPDSSSASTTASIRPSDPVDRPGCVQPDPDPRHRRQRDDRPAAGPGRHHLAPRRHGRHDRPATSTCNAGDPPANRPTAPAPRRRRRTSTSAATR